MATLIHTASIAHKPSCLWGLIVTRLVWPISAQKKLKNGISILWLRMGLIWRRDPLAMLTEGDHPNVYFDLREEFELHRFLLLLEKLRSAAKSEIDLRGPFPDAAYSRILKSTGAMLDAFHAMNVMIMKNPQATKGEAEMLRYTVNERAQLCARISHLFQGTFLSIELANQSLCLQLWLGASAGFLNETGISLERSIAQHRTY